MCMNCEPCLSKYFITVMEERNQWIIPDSTSKVESLSCSQVPNSVCL